MKKQDGRKYIENALKGLILVLGAYALLNTINPQILHFNLSVQNPSINIPSGVNVITPLDSTQAAASDAMKAKLITDTGGAIQVYKGPCVNGSTSGCVNLNGLTDPTVAGLENLVKCAGCTINISGGTEGGHSVGSAHNNGNAVDFSASPQVNAAITSNYSGGLVPGRTYSYNGGRYLWEPAGCLCGGTVASTGDHWHVTYP